MLKYGLEISDLEDKVFIDEVLQALPDYEADIMTTADQLRQQGLAQGLEQGLEQGVAQEKHQTAIKMLEKGTDIDYIHDILGLPKSEINLLRKKLKQTDI